MVMNADGSGQRQLLADVGSTGELAWSPDGNRLAFSATLRTTAMNVFTINADGSALTPLTNDSNSNTSPRWLADGKRLVFSSGSGTTVIKDDGSDRRLFVPRTGGAFVRISPDAALAAVLQPVDFANSAYRLDLNHFGGGRTETVVNQVQGPESPVAWSDDGRWLAYSENSGVDTWVVNIVRQDGSGHAPLVIETILGETASRVDVSVVGWMSDGAGLVYKFSEQTRIGQVRDRYCTVMLADASKVCFEAVFGMNEDGPSSPSLLLN